jgi:hypothetical protein
MSHLYIKKHSAIELLGLLTGLKTVPLSEGSSSSEREESESLKIALCSAWKSSLDSDNWLAFCDWGSEHSSVESSSAEDIELDDVSKYTYCSYLAVPVIAFSIRPFPDKLISLLVDKFKEKLNLLAEPRTAIGNWRSQLQFDWTVSRIT